MGWLHFVVLYMVCNIRCQLVSIYHAICHAKDPHIVPLVWTRVIFERVKLHVYNMVHLDWGCCLHEVFSFQPFQVTACYAPMLATRTQMASGSMTIVTTFIRSSISQVYNNLLLLG